ncbi:N-acetylmuramoyl-L-alanine amidase [Alicyclobacillus dauci]|uniref:N-acetylmuramoyl-L-alanine amidase n=1 Tax=Alicyclobacillus dauci TaxID=1475485 RepID=A0ABY6Z3H0_9BACL|nr:N-acetylmuramoyl-L-alanine amidase [Alicyclobacillus dauci]WAH37422.1 N-acetylmuramoyl-L-alanine amidase [Alicyclobacillus dauci]
MHSRKAILSAVAIALFSMVVVNLLPIDRVSATAVSTEQSEGQAEEPNSEKSSPVVENSLYGRTIVVDAGHGGRDSGARGIGGVQEKDINLSVAQALVRYLHEAGATVITTRTTDTDLATESDRLQKRRHLGDLKGRLGVVREQPIDAFVSIHCNAAPSPDWCGAQVLYLHKNDDGQRLAKTMQETFQETLLPTRRSIQSNRTLYLLKRVKGPTILAEIGFITNPTEASWLQRPVYQDKVAFAMYLALTRYFNESPSEPDDGQ